MARIYVFHLSLAFHRENGGESVSLDDKREKRVNLTQNFVRDGRSNRLSTARKKSRHPGLLGLGGRKRNKITRCSEGNRCLFP